MHLVRFEQDGQVGIGVQRTDGSLQRLPYVSLAAALRDGRDALRATCDRTDLPQVREPVTLLPPADGRMEVWAAGVTYERSRDARVEEAETADVYNRVYGAARPELFFKSVPWRVVTSDEPIGVREDSTLNVPEPELAVVVDAGGSVVGATVCNDVTSRSIEGENPLYLPQAKVYAGACALAPGIRPVWELPDLHNVEIGVTVTRQEALAWEGHTSTASMHRTIEELVSWLYRQDSFPDGVVLATGTGVVPGMDFTLQPDDVVTVVIDGVGELRNRVVTGVAAFQPLGAGERVA